MPITYITFRRRGRSQEIHQAGFDLGSDEANGLAALKHAHNTHSEILPTGYVGEYEKMIAAGGAPLDCGVCRMPVDYDAAVLLPNDDPGHRECRDTEAKN